MGWIAAAALGVAMGAWSAQSGDPNDLAPPAFGKLAELDPALVVTPPPGLEVGYVPIVTRQEAKE